MNRNEKHNISQLPKNNDNLLTFYQNKKTIDIKLYSKEPIQHANLEIKRIIQSRYKERKSLSIIIDYS